MNFNYGIMNKEAISDLKKSQQKLTFKADGWTKYRIFQISKEYDVRKCVVIKAFIQAMLTRYENDNGFNLKFDDQDMIKEYYNMKGKYDNILKKNSELAYKCKSLERKLNKYE